MLEDEPKVVNEWVREKILGSGGFGIVALWRNTNTDEKIAIKKCRGGVESILTDKHRVRWTKEVEIMQRIENRNIVSFKALPPLLHKMLMKHNDSSLPLLSMEFCMKGDLRQVLNRSENCCGLLESDCRDILTDIKNAVAYLHAIKITHRDLKPENIVLQHCLERSNNIIYKLIDLGYAKEIDAKSISASFVGTLQYIAPELLFGKAYSNSVDYWSFGLLAFEVMCGVRPFFHNYGPAPWMDKMKNKKSEDICAYETIDKNIIFSTHMYSENHISEAFRTNIEKWLRLVLEWDSKKRGRLNTELVVFSMLDSILTTKILIIFSVYTYEFLSYEINDTTEITTVYNWLERDTKLDSKEQLLLNSSSEEVLASTLAKNCFDQHQNGSYCLLYLYKINEAITNNCEVVPKIPTLAKLILQEPRDLISYWHRKRANAHGLYFIYQENNLYNTLLEACVNKMNYLINNFNTKKNTIKDMNDSILALQAQKDFAVEILKFDKWKLASTQSNLLTEENWSSRLNTILEHIERLQQAVIQLTIRYESAFRRAVVLHNLANETFSQHKVHDLNNSLEEALSCYSRMRYESKEEKLKLNNCKSMVSIIYNSLKSRDKLLHDVSFHQYMLQINDITKEFDKFLEPSHTALQLTKKYKDDLITAQLDRQMQIWDFNIERKQQNDGGATPNVPVFILGNPNMQSEENVYSLPTPLHFITGDNKLSEVCNQPVLPKHVPTYQTNDSYEEDSSHLDGIQNFSSLPRIEGPSVGIDSTDTAAIISSNLTLRHMLQDKTNESFLHYKSILNDQMEFSILKLVENE